MIKPRTSFILPVAVCLAMLAVLPTAYGQNTWYVDDDAAGDPGPGDPTVSDPQEDGSAAHPFDAIQEAIDAAIGGDTVLVLDGTYTGAGNKGLDYGGKAITVVSENGAEACIVDCAGGGRGFCFESGETVASVVDGLTIANGNTTLGGGVYCVNGSSPTIANCTITGNVGYVGGGIYCHNDCSPLVINCLISGNAVSGGGGGMTCRLNSGPTIVNCTIADNTADGHGGGIYCVGQSYPTVTNCTISNNAAHDSGGGVYCSQSTLALTNCMIIQNSARCYWWGNIEVASNSSVTITNCTITRNTGWDDPSIAVHCTASSIEIVNSILWQNYDAQFGLFDGASLTVAYSDIQGGEDAVWCLDPNTCTVNWGPGNIDADPLFVQADTHLRGDSPCVDAGDPDADYAAQTDMDGETRVCNGRADMGADEFTDVDADGLPDWWEQLHFASPVAGEADADDDADELPNWREYARSRNPWQAPTTYYVDVAGDDAWDGLAPEWDGVHGPVAMIQTGIDLCDDYEQDVVLVADGIYTGHGTNGLDFRGRTLTLRSANGPENCIIDSEGSRRGLRFHRGEPPWAVVDGFTIANGYVSRGGAVFCRRYSSPTIANCRMTRNTVWMFGGAVCSLWGCDPTIVNCTITENTAPSSIFGIGGAVSCYESSATITNCTIVGNTAGYRGGGIDLYGRCRSTIVNSILRDNAAVQGNQIGFCGFVIMESPLGVRGPRITASYSNLQDVSGSGLVWGAGNIDADPFLADPVHGDYRLMAGSPCIDAGDNAAVPPDRLDLDADGDVNEPIPVDFDRNPRFTDDLGMPDAGSGTPPIVDMGACEFQGATCFGDLDRDRDVDADDLVALLLNYATTDGAVYIDGDLDRDGNVDLSDLAALLAVYGRTCPL